MSCPPSSSTRYFCPFSARKPSKPCAIYSRVIIRYLRPPFVRSMGSASTSTGAGDVAPLGRLVVDALAECIGVGDALVFTLPLGSCRSHTPSTRCPGGRRESQETRKPEIVGKRLRKCDGKHAHNVDSFDRKTHPSWAGHVASDCSSASQIASPSSSSATTGSSKGRISRMSPSVKSPAHTVCEIRPPARVDNKPAHLVRTPSLRGACRRK